MSIWNKILLGLILVASLAFFHAAARTVKTYSYWANLAYQFEDKLNKVNKEIVDLKTADRDHPLEDKTLGVQQLRIDLGRTLANRGRIWPKCEKQKAPVIAPSGTLEVAVSTEDPPETFNNKMLLYVFEEGDDQSPGKYLGEFRVKEVGQKVVVLASTTQMLKSTDMKVKTLADDLAESKGPWVLYEMMPTDEHEAFANLTDDQKKWLTDAFAKLPVEQRKLVTDEYLNDEQTDVDGKKKFVRPLRDYLEVLRSCEMHRTFFADQMEAAVRDRGYLEAAKQGAEAEEALVQKEKTQFTKELERAKAELAAVENLNAARQNMIDIYQRSVKEGIEKNLEYAREIARLQKDAADKIDARMRNLAQFGPRAN